MSKQLFLLTTAFVLLASGLSAQAPGTTDLGFGVNGIVQSPFLTFASECRTAALQQDGKIILAGQYTSGGTGKFAFARYNPDGTFDLSFGVNGKATIDLNVTGARANAVQVLSNGKIITAGTIDSKPGILRLNADGSLDTGFGTAGAVTFDESITSIVDLIILPNSKMVGCGIADRGNGKEFAVFRRNADGSPDNAFGASGYAYFNVGQLPGLNRMAVQPDGKILLTGTTYNTTSLYDMVLFRCTANGQADNTFGTNGIVTKVLGSNQAYEQGNAIAVQLDGKIVVAGRIANAGPTVFAVARFNANGSSDNTFGTNGAISFNFSNTLDEAKAVAVQGDGKIVVAGVSYVGSNREMALARLTKNGTLDAGFGNGGKVSTAVGTRAFGEAVLIQPDGKIIVAGYADISNLRQFVAARYHAGQVVGAEEAAPVLSGLRIAPNPVTKGHMVNVLFSLEEAADATVRMTDANGRLVLANNILPFVRGANTLPLSLPADLPSGTYFLQLEVLGQVFTAPLAIR